MIPVTAEWVKENLPKYRGVKSEAAEFVGIQQATVTRILSGERALKADEAKLFYQFIQQKTALAMAPGLSSSPEERETLLNPCVASAAAPQEPSVSSVDTKASSKSEQSDAGFRRLLPLLLSLNDQELHLITAAAEGLVASKKRT